MPARFGARRIEGRVASYSAEATALFARMSVAPDATRKGHIDTLIGVLKTAGIWSKLDLFYILAAHDAQAARLNWVSSSYDCTAVNSPTFTVDRGYQGDGATSCLDTGFNPGNAAGRKYAQNSAHLSFWSRTAGETAGDMGSDTNLCFFARVPTNTLIHRVNNGAGSVTNTDGSGDFIASRTGSAAADSIAYRNGVALGAAANASGAVPTTGTLTLLKRNSPASFSNRQHAAASVGSGLTAAEALALYNARQAYMTAVGA